MPVAKNGNHLNLNDMELEELKRSWLLLSERLERSEVIRRQETDCLLKCRIGSYLRYAWSKYLLGCAGLPAVVAIGLYRGVDHAVIRVLGGCYLLAMLFALGVLCLLTQVGRCKAGMEELERRMTRYFLWNRIYILSACILAVVPVAWMLVANAGYYSAHGIWWRVAAGVGLGLAVSVAWVWYDWDRIRALRERIRELREFGAGRTGSR